MRRRMLQMVLPALGAVLWAMEQAGGAAPAAPRAELSFQQVVLDDPYIAYEREAGDIDRDGRNDVVAVMEGDTTVQVFPAPTWRRSTLITFPGDFRYPRADNFKLADIEGDGDLDVVTRLGKGPSDDGAGIAVWCENLGGSNFVQHLIGDSLEYVKDIVVADFDRDGRPDVAMRMDSRTQLWLQEPGGTWTEVLLTHPAHEGMEAGDLDMDGDPDLIGIRNWNSAPTWICRNNVRSPGLDRWTYHRVSAAHVRTFGLCFPDVDGDGDPDLILAEHRGTRRIAVWENDGHAGFSERRVDEGHESHLGGPEELMPVGKAITDDVLLAGTPSLPATSDTRFRGPLRIHPTNPHYFTDDSGRAISLTGSHTWANLIDRGPSDPPPVFDFNGYLDLLQKHHHNFIRLWGRHVSWYHGYGEGLETHTLQVPGITGLQETYVRRMVDFINDLDNVLYGISNEGEETSVEWQYHLIRLIHAWEATMPRQHPVGMTALGSENASQSNAALSASPAQWISPHTDAWGGGQQFKAPFEGDAVLCLQRMETPQ